MNGNNALLQWKQKILPLTNSSPFPSRHCRACVRSGDVGRHGQERRGGGHGSPATTGTTGEREAGTGPEIHERNNDGDQAHALSIGHLRPRPLPLFLEIFNKKKKKTHVNAGKVAFSPLKSHFRGKIRLNIAQQKRSASIFPKHRRYPENLVV